MDSGKSKEKKAITFTLSKGIKPVNKPKKPAVAFNSADAAAEELDSDIPNGELISEFDNRIALTKLRPKKIDPIPNSDLFFKTKTGGDTTDAGTSLGPNITYGLSVPKPKEQAKSELDRGKNAFRKGIIDIALDDLKNLPEEASLEDYQEIPVDDFGTALLRGMGWQEGRAIGRRCKTAAPMPEVKRRPVLLGLGAKPVQGIHKIDNTKK